MKIGLVGPLKLGRRLCCVGGRWGTGGRQALSAGSKGADLEELSGFRYQSWVLRMRYVALRLPFLSQVNRRTLGTCARLRAMWQASYHHWRSWDRPDCFPSLWVPVCWEELNGFLASRGNSDGGANSEGLEESTGLCLIHFREKFWRTLSRTNRYDRIFDLAQKSQIITLT